MTYFGLVGIEVEVTPMFPRTLCAALAALMLTGCANHPVDCAAGISWDDCLPGTAGYRRPHSEMDPAQQQRRQMMGAYLMSHPIGAPYQQPYMVPVRPSYNTNCTTIGGITSCNTQ